jgi:hypothetical protein
MVAACVRISTGRLSPDMEKIPRKAASLRQGSMRRD